MNLCTVGHLTDANLSQDILRSLDRIVQLLENQAVPGQHLHDNQANDAEFEKFKGRLGRNISYAVYASCSLCPWGSTAYN